MKTISQDTEQAFDLVIDDVSVIAQTFLPQFAAYILLGRVIAHAAPELYNDAVKLVTKAEPTPEEKADLARKLRALANPEENSGTAFTEVLMSYARHRG